MDVTVGCTLKYTIKKPTGFVLQIEAAKADGQTVVREELHIPAGANADYAIYVNPVTLTRVVRTILGPGSVEINYEADIALDTIASEPSAVDEFLFATLPMEYLEYVTPSRYCPSDIFSDFAHGEFGTVARGYSRVTAICDWIFDNIVYRAGSTGPNSTAADVFQSRAGVCRDFAHLGISLCRAIGIPARYASVYAHGLVPPDFHAVFQAYLLGPGGGAWYTFDPTRMSSADAVVRIAAGRDAADVAFAWPQGPVEFVAPVVWAKTTERVAGERTLLAVGS